MSDTRRLHPTSPAFNIVRHARSLLAPGIAVLFVGGESWQLWLMLLFVPSAIFEIVRFFTFRYTLSDDQIVTSMAFIGRTERSVRYGRIQNVESVQSVFHRLFGVTEVCVETGAGGKPEVVLRVVPVGEVERIRERVFAGSPARTPGPGEQADTDSPAAEAPSVELLRLRGLDFVRLGMITMRGLVLVAIVLGLAWEFKLFDKLAVARDWVLHQLRATSDLSVGLTAGAVVLLIASALIGGSVLWALLRFGGFRLTRRGDDFRIESGLLTRIGATVPRRRIQLVRLTESFQHRRFERAAISVETAGGVDPESGNESSFGRQWFAPLVELDRIPVIAKEIRPSLSLDAEPWHRLSPRAKRRMLRKSLLIVGPVTIAIAAAVFFVGGWWLAGLVVAGGVASALFDRRGASMIRYQRSPDWIGCRTGVLTRQTSVAFLDRVQVVDITESPFDRRARMATLRIDTAGGGPMGPKVDLPMLDAAQAAEHALAVATAAERGGFVW